MRLRRDGREDGPAIQGARPACKQSEINSMMIALARAGRRVVRLKGGDPMIFGRAPEEIAACRDAGIAVEVVPGITAAQGAAARLGVSLTQRKDARRVQYVTGHGADGKLPGDIDWRSIADPTATTIVYMPVKTLGELTTKAIEAGLDPATPAVAIARATRSDQSTIAAPISELPQRLADADLPGPVVVMVGKTFGELAAAQGVATVGSSDSTLRISF